MCPIDRRLVAWERLAVELRPDQVDEMTVVAKLADVPRLAEEILAGKTRGRVVVEVNP